MENKNQYLCLENWVYAARHPQQILLYNTCTGQYIISENQQHRAIVEAMHERKNLGVVLVEKAWADNSAVSQFIDEAVEKNIFSLENEQEGQLKPIRLMPVLNIQKDVERLKGESDRSVGETSLSYLTELSLYVNNQCALSCNHCGQSCRQFMCCSRDNNAPALDSAILEKIATQIKYAPILKLNIVGGNLFSYPLSDKIPEIFEDKKAQIHFWSHYKNFRPSEHPVIWDIVVDFPVDEQVLSNCIAGGMQETAQYHYHFIVQNEGEINLVEKMTAHFDIQDFEMHPYYNGANFDFFKNCIFLNRDDILSSTIAQRRIFCNQALNSNFFGSLTILSNGDVTATMNTPVLGNIFTTSLLELITKELKQNTAWRKTRNEPPCNACLFQYLCPPISNYEMTFQRQNLCTLYENG